MVNRSFRFSNVCINASCVAIAVLFAPLLLTCIGCENKDDVLVLPPNTPIKTVARAFELAESTNKVIVWPPLSVKIDAGILSHDLVVSNECPDDLHDISLQVTLYREDGEKPIVNRFWSEWRAAEVKKINVPSHHYQRVVLTGTASDKRQLPLHSEADFN